MFDAEKWKQGPDGSFFTPEGAMVWPDEGTVVVADLHLGYEATRAKSGDHLPEWSLQDVQKRLAKLFLALEVKKLVVAGDVTESKVATIGRESIVQQFQAWLEHQNIEPILLFGNHDHTAGTTSFFRESYVIQDWLIHHGHHSLKRLLNGMKGQITGHFHPVIKWRGHTFRTFLSSPRHVILPAFTSDASGLDLLTADHFLRTNVDSSCWVCSDSEVLDFGLVSNLRSKMSLS